MNVIPKHVVPTQPLAMAHASNFDEVGQLYESNPACTESWSERLRWLDETESTRIDRSLLTQCLRQFNATYNPHPEVEQSLNRLEQPGTAVIAGGQQSGLFSGPLLVIYKAVSIIKSAAEASKLLGRAVVPLFWIAGEDHDWDEVNHSYILSTDLQLKRIRISKDQEKRLPVSMTQVNSEEWERAIQELEQLLPGTEFRSGIMELLHRCVEDSATLSQCFARLMGHWFGKHGLILLDSADPNLRKLEIPVFEQMIGRNDELEAAYHESLREMTSLGFTPQAEVAEGGANLFYIDEGERRLLFKRDGKFIDRKGNISFQKDELLKVLHEYPERFSNNVLTRPLMQDSLLPVLGAVLGHGEIAYWGLTRRAFHQFGLRMPILVARESFTIIEGTVQKHMDKHELDWEDVADARRLQDIRNAWLTKQDAVQVDARFDEVRSAFGSMYDPLIDQLGTIQNGLLKLGAANKEKILDQIEYLRGRAKDALEKSNEAGLRHFDRIEMSLLPAGKLQERVFNIFYYINRYGPDLIDRLMEIPYDQAGGHRIIHL